MADQDPQPLTETEEQLAADAEGSAVKALVAELDAIGADIKKQADSGLPPEEFRKAEALGAAVNIAKEVAGKTWAQLNKNT